MNRKNAEIRVPKVGNNPGTLKAEALEISGKRSGISGFRVRGSHFRIAKRVKPAAPGKSGVLELC